MPKLLDKNIQIYSFLGKWGEIQINEVVIIKYPKRILIIYDLL